LVVVAAGLSFTAASPAQAATGWQDSAGVSAQTTNCLTGAAENLITSRVGWLGDPAAPPPVNSVYYVRIWWGVTGNPCIGGARVAPELFLPEGTTLAISASNPVKCYARKLQTTTPELSACPQSASAGQRGGLGFYPVGQQTVTWPSAQGRGWEIQVPVLSSRTLNGTVTSPNPETACPSCLTGGVWAIDGVQSPWTFPRVGVRITGPTVPTITYPAPSTTSVTATTAQGAAVLTRQETTGTAYVQISDTPPSGATCPNSGNTVSITAQYTVWNLTVSWTGLSPATTYYWRYCYTTGALTYWGTTQTFRTAGAPAPRILSVSPDTALPGARVTLTGSHLASITALTLTGGGIHWPVTPATASDSTVTFTVPQLTDFYGWIQASGPSGTTLSPTRLTVGIDTIIDTVSVADLDGGGQKDDVDIRFHTTEPFPFAQATCQLAGSPTTSSCDAGSVRFKNLAPGKHQANITARIQTPGGLYTDLTPAQPSFTISNGDTTPPNTTILTGPADDSAIAATSATFTFSSPDTTATYECRSGPEQLWTACKSPVSWSGLDQGRHVFLVRAKDRANNVDATPAYRGFTVDSVPPETAITAGPANGSSTTSRTASFSFIGIEGNGFQCSLDIQPFTACSGSRTYASLAVGQHTFRVRTRDRAGNTDPTPAARKWTVKP
jgi:hypothetical protein